jgi:hypothetical protein
MKKSLTVLLLVAFSFFMKGTAQTLSVQIKNARKDGKTVYIQPDKTFLYKDAAMTLPLTGGSNTDLSTLPLVSGSTDTYQLYASQNSNNISLRIYFSIGDNTLPVTTSGEHAPLDPGMDSVRFDWVEATLDGSAFACINLTSLEQLGICFTLEAKKSGKTLNTLGWKQSLNTVKASAGTIAPTSIQKYTDPNTGTTSFIRVKGAHSYPSIWKPGIDGIFGAVANQTITIAGYYVGSDKDPQACSFNFTGTFDSTGKNITLKGTFGDIYPSAKMQVQNISVKTIFLAQEANTGCTITCSNAGSTIPRPVDNNDKWECLFNFLMTGFNTGFWANAATRNNLNWTETAQFTGSYYNQYSALIHNASNSYGDPYSDCVAGNKVQLNLDPARVDTALITILDDDSTGDYSKTVSTISGYQVSCNQSTGPVEMYFNDDPTSTVPFIAGTAGFASSVVKNAYNKISLVFYKKAKTHPYVKVYLPADPTNFTPANNPPKTKGWSVPDGGSTSSMFQWNSGAAPILWTLQLDNDVIPSNFNPNALSPIKYQITCGVDQIQGAIYGATTNQMEPEKAGQCKFTTQMMKDRKNYTKVSLVFSGQSKPYPYIWVYIPDDPTATPSMDVSGWHIPHSTSPTGMFSWMSQSGNPAVLWNLQFSGDVKPANFDASKAKTTAPAAPTTKIKSGNVDI